MPPAGTIGLTHVAGLLHPAIRLGQAAAGDWSQWTHAFVVIDRDEMFEARPGGARIVALDRYLAGRVAYDVPVFWLYGWPKATPAQISDLAAMARTLVGTPYGWADYASLALLGAGLQPKWLRKRVADSGRLICSQAVDELFLRVGVHLFDDGRQAGDVTPGDLADGYAEAMSRANTPT
jgi:hypothetical protein